MAKLRKFKILKWPDAPSPEQIIFDYDLQCSCGKEVILPVRAGTVAIARLGMGLVYDYRPKNHIPHEIQCPWCKKQYVIDDGKEGE
jgi:redox-regulated HSP33 family molecular chaperone